MHKMYFSNTYPSYTNFMILGSDLVNNGKYINLNNLGYKEMAGSYKCTVTGVVGQNSGSSTLEVYCKFEIIIAYKEKSSCFQQQTN